MPHPAPPISPSSSQSSPSHEDPAAESAANPAADAPPKPQAPDELLDALLSVFSAHGFDGASLQDLARASNRSKASLYHHFPGGKHQMIEVLVARCQNTLDRLAFAPLRQANGALGNRQEAKDKRKNGASKRSKKVQAAAQDSLTAFVDGFSGYLHAHQGNCLLATLALTQPSLLGDEQRQRLADWLAALTSACEHMGHKPKAARRLAQASLARLYGSLTLAAMGSHVSVNQACKWLKRDLLVAP